MTLLFRAILLITLLFQVALGFRTNNVHAQGRDTVQVADEIAPRMRAGVLFTYEALQWTQPDWNTLTVFARRRSERFTVTLEGHRVTRFDHTDYAGAVDAYATLWEGSYGNLRVQVAPQASILPGADISGEVFQSVARVWEASAGYRGLFFEEDRVDVYSAGLGRYVGNWYVRGRGSLVPHDGTRDFYFAGTARYYWNGIDEYAELVAGAGREVVTLGTGQQFDVRPTRFIAVRVQRPLLSSLSYTLGAGYTDDELFDRFGITVGLAAVW